MNRSRKEYYEDEYQPQYHHQAGAPYGVEGMPYPNAAAHGYHQQNAMMAQMNMAHGHGVRYYDQKHAGQPEYYEQSETSYDVTTSDRHERRHSGLYDDGMPSSTTRTETERTGRYQTSSSSRSSSYTSGTSSSESGGLGEGIVSALNDISKNIRCTNQGQTKKTKDLQMKLPLPMEGFREVMGVLSPKNCAQNYNYDNLDNHVMEEQFFGNIHENVMPVYKSLFQSQSESSDGSDEDESESTYEDPRFAAQRQQQQLLEQQAQYEMAAGIPDRTPVPMQIVISSQPSGISSAGSWKLMSPRDRPPPSNLPTSPVHDGFIPSYKRTMQVENPEMMQKQMPSKSNPRDKNIPHVIGMDTVEVVECYSDLTNGVRMSARQKSEKERSTSGVPAIKTHFSGDEAMDQRKTSFLRNSAKREAELAKERRLKEEQEMAKKIEEQREKARLKQEERQRELEEEQRQREAEAALAAKKALQKKKLEEKVEAELQAARANLQAKKLEAERKRRDAEERAAKQKALEEKRLAEEAKKLEEERRLREAEERAQLELKRIEAEERAKQIAFEAKRLEEERKLREAEERRERELKRIEALERAEKMASEAKRLEEERLRREAQEKAVEEARKAKELERERRRVEAETKAAQEKLEALYTQKLEEERRQRDEQRRQRELERKEREQREQERKARKLKEMRDRVEAEARAEEEAKRERMLSAERKRREAEKKASEDARKARELEKERKQSRRIHSDEQSRASLYKVQGFDDYCKSVASGNRHDIDLSDDETESYSSNFEDMDTQSQSEDSSVGSSSSDDYSQSNDSCGVDDGSNIFTDNDVEVTERLRNHNDFDRQFSGARSVNSARSVQMKNSKSFSNLSRPPLSKPPLKPSKFTSNETIPITATMSTFQTTFDQGTVVSGHHSLGRFIKSSDESVASTYSHQSVISAKPVALPVNTLPREPKKKSKPVPIGRSSIVGTIMSFALKLSLRVAFTVILFLYTWFKHFVVKAISGKKEAKLDCTPSKHAVQPDKSVMSEKIQGGARDNRQNRNLGYDAHNKGDHYSTTMIIKPPSYVADDHDEVGTCVESIVPDTHYPAMSNGKMSSWKITQKNTDASSVSSRSFGVLMKKTYSALSTRREAEKSNWLDHANIDDEMSYYE